MPSRRLPQRPTPTPQPDARGGRRLARWPPFGLAASLALLLAALLLGACASRPAPPPHRRPPEKAPELALGRQDRAYLADPLEGYADAVGAAQREPQERALRR